MSLLGTIYTSMSGLAAASKGLDNLSNNVANINTPGYKANDIFFKTLSGNGTGTGNYLGSAPYMDPGQGAEVSGGTVRFTAGDISETGVSTDMAIEGNGLFILRQDGAQYYTRAGQFRFDENGYLIDPGSGFRVAALDENDRMMDIDINQFETKPFQPSSLIELEGGLNTATAVGETLPPDESAPIELQVVDENGAGHTLELQFTKLSGNRWSVDFLSTNGSALQASHILEFNSLGTPLVDTLQTVLNFEDFEYLTDERLKEEFSAIDRSALNEPIDISLTNEARLITLDNGNIQFVAAGSFVLNEAGLIVDANSGRVLGGRDADGRLTDFDLSDKREMPAQATSVVTLNGTLNRTYNTPSPDSGSAIIYPPTAEPGISLPVLDSEGNSVELTLRFRRATSSGDLWDVLVRDERDPDNIVTANVTRSLGFDSLGNLLNSTVNVSIDPAAEEALSFTLDFSGGEAAAGLTLVADTSANEINLLENNGFVTGNLVDIAFDADGKSTLYYSNGQTLGSLQLAVATPTGRPVSNVVVDFAQVSNIAGAAGADIEVARNDGSQSSALTSLSFLRDGGIEAQYANGDKETVGSVALAYFSNPQLLKPVDKTLFENINGLLFTVGRPDSGALGALISNSIELSNVDLSKEFADIIIVQRGYQASSQVLNVSNEMIEELYNSVKGR